MEKILFLGQGSPNDPGFKGIEVGGVPYKAFMDYRGITVYDGIVESCHGCPDLMTKYSRELQLRVENGDRVVAVLQGGLLFGLPSIQATQTTFPIISVPLDDVAYTAFMVPPGHAAIASVGVDHRSEVFQKIKALTLAERILNLDNHIVNIFADEKHDEALRTKFHRLGGATYSIDTPGKSALSLVYGTQDEMKRVPEDSFVLRADPYEDLKDWSYFRRSEDRHHYPDYNLVPTMEARGLDNLAIFAAKIISLQKPEIRERLLELARKKRESYEERNLLKEAF